MKIKKTTTADGRPMYILPENLSYLIPGDIHFPVHSERLVKEYTVGTGADCLILNGDTGDQDAFSKYSKDPEKMAKSGGMVAERHYFKKWLDIWKQEYEYIVLFPGNHETRAYRSTCSNPAYIGMDWWWPYGSLFNDKRIVIGDMSYIARVGNTFIEHGDLLKGAEGNMPSVKAAEYYANGANVVFGHSHRCQVGSYTSYVGGKKKVTTAYNTGTLCDVSKVKYAARPNWQPGAVIIRPYEQPELYR
jgi:predicted phosphodiesterase